MPDALNWMFGTQIPNHTHIGLLVLEFESLNIDPVWRGSGRLVVTHAGPVFS